MKYCLECHTELTESNYFCNESCEKAYRETSIEFYVYYKDFELGTVYASICPVLDFKETEEEYVVHNGSFEYRYLKSNVIRYLLGECDCLREFTESKNTLDKLISLK